MPRLLFLLPSKGHLIQHRTDMFISRPSSFQVLSVGKEDMATYKALVVGG